MNSFHYASHEELKKPLNAYPMAYTFAQWLKAIQGKTLTISSKSGTIHPEYFKLNPNHF